MPRAMVDTSVLFAGAYRRDAGHENGLSILRGIDDASLPEAVVVDYVLGETLNGLVTRAGHDAAVEFLDRLEENARFHVESLTSDAFATAKSLFRRHEPFSFVDACIVAYMRIEEIEYLYAFDDDFDRIENVYRLETAVNPHEPE